MEEIEILNRLRADHDHLRKLLFLLEREIEGHDAPDVHVLLGCLKHCEKYANDIHHPRESLVYSPLCAIPGKLSQRLGESREEHSVLVEAARELCAHTEDACRNIHDLARHYSGLRHFIDHFRRHMAREEDFLFPAACIHLRAEEWHRISSRLRELEGPRDDTDVGARYAGILQRLNTMASQHHD